ncbi:MAG: hypothetical protein HY834_10720 [Devosia nanyangense]|uniref:Uncharacterized protein n=1 Tax=Devosia nanyangense TaxID=1228055 RepID=A0A933L1F6_9HYPH|nr:hypothetical protein [Devosia nanyangense]
MTSQRRFPGRVYGIVLALIALFGLAPIIVTVASAAIANAYGCTISESFLSPCIINGADWGPGLQLGGISFWYVLLVWPAAFVLFLVWLVVLLIHLARFRKRIA